MNTFRTKIISGYAVFLLILLATSFYAMYIIRETGSSVEKIISENYHSVIAAENMLKIVDRQIPDLYDPFVNHFGAWETMFEKNKAQFWNYYKMGVRGIALPEEPDILANIKAAYMDFIQLANSLKLAKDSSPSRLLAEYVALTRTGSEIKAMINHLLKVNHKAIRQTGRQMKDIAFNGIIAMIIATLAAISLGIIAAFQFKKIILRPITKLKESIHNLREGQLDQKLDFSSYDEFAQIAGEFNKMTERLKEYEEINIQKLIAEKNKSEAIVESIADPLLVTDAAGQVLLFNKAAETKLGIKQSGTPKHVSKLLQHSEMKNIFSPSYKKMEDTSESSATTIQFQREDELFYFRPRQAEIADSANGFKETITMLEDVTAFKELDQMKSDFLATVSHELRTPLTSLNMTVNILQQQELGQLNEEQKDLLEIAKSDCERLKSLIRHLLEHAKNEHETDSIRIATIFLDEFIYSALEPFQLILKEKKVDTIVDLDKDLPSVKGDHQKLLWVLNNLLDNAIKYSPENGTLKIKAIAANEHVKITVSDEGPGITPEIRETIFERYIHDNKGPGVGLGLAVAKSVIEAHNGQLILESSGPEGSTFSFTIPNSSYQL